MCIEKVGTLSDRDKKFARAKYASRHLSGVRWHVYEGVVTSIETDSQTGKVSWTVLYSDGVSGDLLDNELIAYGVDYAQGQ